jgi:hypothetical protein
MPDSATLAQEITPPYGIWLLTVAASVGLIFSLIDYFTPHGAIAQSGGALLVVISTALMLGAGLSIALAKLPRWLVALLGLLIILDVIGTGIAAYFLEADVLMVSMGGALFGWIVSLFSDSPRVAAL